jgi:hypothetical protein
VRGLRPHRVEVAQLICRINDDGSVISVENRVGRAEAADIQVVEYMSADGERKDWSVSQANNSNLSGTMGIIIKAIGQDSRDSGSLNI